MEKVLGGTPDYFFLLSEETPGKSQTEHLKKHQEESLMELHEKLQKALNRREMRANVKIFPCHQTKLLTPMSKRQRYFSREHSTNHLFGICLNLMALW